MEGKGRGSVQKPKHMSVSGYFFFFFFFLVVPALASLNLLKFTLWKTIQIL